jgi:GNAT superfamily N-acetyltransferase
MRFERATATPQAIKAYIDLFNVCFPAATHYTVDYLTWLYAANPAGEVIGYDAWEGAQLVAHYACIPAPVSLRGNNVTALLSLNTATHPAHQGKGLFTKLAELAYATAYESGVSLVYGVANQNSIRGFSGRLGFQDVIGLEARIGVGPLSSIDWDTERACVSFARRWPEADLAWRMANPVNPLRARRQDNGSLALVGRTPYPMIRVAGLVDGRMLGSGLPAQSGVLMSPRLTLGLTPSALYRRDVGGPIPVRFRPSPLRFIYRNLHDPSDRLDPDAVLFRFVDFDAY